MSFQRFRFSRPAKAKIFRISRSRLAKPSTGSALENISKLLQILAIVIGGAWVLKDYYEFKKANNEFVNRQAELAIATGKLTEALDTLKLEHSKEGRIDSDMGASVTRSTRFDDGTFLYRYYVWLKVKNISDTRISIPAVVVEHFLGTASKDELKPNEALYVNLPPQWQQQEKDVTGSISWTRKGAYMESKIENRSDQDLVEQIPPFPKMAIDFAGSLPSGTFTDIGVSFLLRARPDAIAGAVITIWARGRDDFPLPVVFSHHDFLSDAEDASAQKKSASEPRSTESTPP
jgi:hypothetical protein